jgi:hypothetical protein
MAQEGVLSYPGLKTIITASIPRHHGITPNVITIECAPQDSLPDRVGTIDLQYGQNRIRIPDCIVDSTQFRFDDRGNLWSIKLYDYRWKWQNDSNLEGRYNVRLPNGPIDRLDPLTEKKMADLIKYCTDKIKLPAGRKFYTVGTLPTLNPPIYWSYANPATELQKLCDLAGFRIVPQINGDVYLVPRSRSLDGTTAAKLPKGLPVKNDNTGYDPPELPDKMIFVCGPTRFQFTLPMEAVCDDTDGLVKTLDDVSFKPSNGWGGDLVNFRNVSLVSDLSKWHNLPNPRQLAMAGVFKKYRIRVLKGDGTPFVTEYIGGGQGRGFSKLIYLPGCPVTVKDVRQILPIGQELIEPVKTDQGWYRNLPFLIWGNYAYGKTNNYDDSAVDATGYPYDAIPQILCRNRDPITGEIKQDSRATYLEPETYHMDSDTGIVTINGPVNGRIFRYNKDTSLPEPARLWCRGTCQVSDWGTWVPVRVEVSKTVPNKGPKTNAGNRYIQDSDIFQRVVPDYKEDQISLDGDPKTNMDTINKYASQILGTELDKLQDLKPASAEYIGWWPINLDGGIEEIVYTLGQGGCFTQASLHNERFVLSMGYEERRFYEQAADERSDPKKHALLDLIREKDMPYSRASGATRSSR